MQVLLTEEEYNELKENSESRWRYNEIMTEYNRLKRDFEELQRENAGLRIALSNRDFFDSGSITSKMASKGGFNF